MTTPTPGKDLKAQGIRLFQGKKYKDAVEIFRRAIDAFGTENDSLGVAEMQANLGLCLRNLERYEESIDEMQKALAYFKENKHEIHEAQLLGNMALSYAELKEVEQAETYYRTSAAIFREHKEMDKYGEIMMALADMRFHNHDYMMAIGIYEEGVQHVRDKSQRQKMLKQLMVAKNFAMMGGQPVSSDGEAEEANDSRKRRSGRGLRGLLKRGKDETEETPEGTTEE
jgi:tetratricopeptide (TPR) repeat protein